MKRILVLALVLLFSGCAYVNPLIQDFNIISVEEEKAIGDQVTAEIQKEMTIVSDSALTARIRNIGEALEAALPPHAFNYQFYVVENKTPNAFSVPGGSIYVHTGLLNFVDDENQLAGVLAHEIGHEYQRHPAKSLSRAYGLEQLSSMLFKNSKSQNQIRSIALQLAGGGVLSRYSRIDELEADSIGFQLLRRSGMRVDGLKRFLIKLNNLYGSGGSIPLMSSHPPTAERITRLDMMERNGGQMLQTP